MFFYRGMFGGGFDLKRIGAPLSTVRVRGRIDNGILRVEYGDVAPPGLHETLGRGFDLERIGHR